MAILRSNGTIYTLQYKDTNNLASLSKPLSIKGEPLETTLARSRLHSAQLESSFEEGIIDLDMPQTKIERDMSDAMTTITLALDLTHVGMIVECKTPREVIQILDDQYLPNTITHKIILLRKLFSFRMGDDTDIMRYLGEWETLTTEVLSQRIEMDTLFAFLLLEHMPRRLHLLKEILEHTGEELTHKKVKALLQTEADKQRSTRILRDKQPLRFDDKTKALFAKDATPSTTPSPYVCAYCREPDHHINDCKKLDYKRQREGQDGNYYQPYTSNFDSRSRSRSNSRSRSDSHAHSRSNSRTRSNSKDRSQSRERSQSRDRNGKKDQRGRSRERVDPPTTMRPSSKDRSSGDQKRGPSPYPGARKQFYVRARHYDSANRTSSHANTFRDTNHTHNSEIYSTASSSPSSSSNSSSTSSSSSSLLPLNHFPTSRPDYFIADTGCNQTMTFQYHLYDPKSYRSFDVPTVIEGTSKINAYGVGSIPFSYFQNGLLTHSEFTDVLYVPDLPQNLYSLRRATQRGFSYHGTNDILEIKRTGTSLFAYSTNDGLWQMDIRLENQAHQEFPPSREYNDSLTYAFITKSELYHNRFGHISFPCIAKMSAGLVEDIDKIVAPKDTPFCEPCAIAKAKTQPMSRQLQPLAEKKLGRVHTDLCGPFATRSLSHAKSFLIFVDSKTKMVWIYFLRKKSETMENLQ